MATTPNDERTTNDERAPETGALDLDGDPRNANWLRRVDRRRTARGNVARPLPPPPSSPPPQQRTDKTV